MTTATATKLRARVKRADLLKAMKALLPLAKGTTIPPLGGVLLTADENGTLTGRTTNMELALRMTIEATVMEAGTILPGARELFLAATFATADDLELVEGNLSLTVRAGGDEFTVQCFGPDQFPKAVTGHTPLFTIGRADLAEMAATVSACVGKDESKPWIQCIHISAGNGVKALSTDGCRVARWKKPIIVHEPTEVNVPPAGLKLAASLAAPGEEIRVEIHPNTIRLVGHEFEIISRTVEGQYPDIERLVPLEYSITAVLDARALMDTGRLAVRWHKAGAVKLFLSPGVVAASVIVPEVGSFVRRHPATVTGTLDGCGIDAKLMIPLLQHFRAAEVTLGFTGSRNPMQISSASMPHLVYALLPLLTY